MCAVSIIVNNHNYGAFLSSAIESALAQSHPQREIVVVDDGSTDDSRAVIASYGQKVIPVLKANGGQASAFSAGLAASKGDVVLFLDADDMLLPQAAQRAVEELARPDAVKAHWPLWVMDEAGNRTGQVYPRTPLAEGNLLAETIRHGVPGGWRHPPTSGNAWKRSFLEAVSPIRECGDKHGADGFLCVLSPIFGRLCRVGEPLSLYRIHPSNFAAKRNLGFRLRRDFRRYEFYFRWIEFFLQQRGFLADTALWRQDGSAYAWTRDSLALVEDLSVYFALGQPYILVDDGRLGTHHFPGARPMMERDGQYWGAPEDDQQAIDELERQRKVGAKYIVFAPGTFWWFDYYGRFDQYLKQRFPCVLSRKHVVAFEIK